MFAELLELADLRFEPTLPAYLPTGPTMASPDGAQVAESVLVSTNTPTSLLQHPGYYFYAAADCTVQRRARFLQLSRRASGQAGIDQADKVPGLVNEQKVDHMSIILEVCRIWHFTRVSSTLDRSRSLFSYSPKHTVISSISKEGKGG
jgi:hypothetical protein